MIWATLCYERWIPGLQAFRSIWSIPVHTHTDPCKTGICQATSACHSRKPLISSDINFLTQHWSVNFYCCVLQIPPFPVTQIMKVQPQGCFPALFFQLKHAPSCSFPHPSSWARELGRKDAPCLLWLQLMSPWFVSNRFWASYCLSPKSHNWTVLSCSNLDWTTDICFNKGKSTHCLHNF